MPMPEVCLRVTLARWSFQADSAWRPLARGAAALIHRPGKLTARSLGTTKCAVAFAAFAMRTRRSIFSLWRSGRTPGYNLAARIITPRCREALPYHRGRAQHLHPVRRRAGSKKCREDIPPPEMRISCGWACFGRDTPAASPPFQSSREQGTTPNWSHG